MTEGEKEVLVKEFHAEMVDVYRRALREHKYKATFFIAMVGEHGGLEAANILLHAADAQSGLERLRELDALDISMEWTVLQPRFAPLFSADELQIARDRLTAMGYTRQKL